MALVLVGMAGVVVDVERGFLKKWEELYPGVSSPLLPADERSTVNLKWNSQEDYRRKVADIYESQGFFPSLPPMPGALEALLDMSVNHDVILCSSNHRSELTDKYYVGEKYEWVERNLGPDWVKRLVLIDKTVLRGDVLIDDNASITGLIKTPSWKHVLYDSPVNRRTTKHRLNWDPDDKLYWARVLPIVLA